jgi:phosphoglycerate dehydrogenase-like enzyme
LNIACLVRLKTADADAIRAISPEIELVEAGGWFDGEFKDTWPTATASRYVPGEGSGTRAQRDQILTAADVVVGGFPYPLDLCARAPRLRWLHQTPAGASNLRNGDIWGKPITVTTSRGRGEVLAIAEYAISSLLYVAKGFDIAVEQRTQGNLVHAPYSAVTALRDKTLCVIGAGGIGREVGRLGHALGMRVLGTRNATALSEEDACFERIDAASALHEQLAEADFVAVCCQWTDATTDLLDDTAFNALKPGAALVNVARGEIIDEDALLRALANDQLRGAVLDVYVGEFEGPPRVELRQHSRVLITPHTSNKTDISDRADQALFRTNLQRFLDGEPLVNQVDWARGY